MPVNVRAGAVLTEARGIFIRNLSYKCTSDDLNALLLQTVGYAIDIQLMKDGRTGAFKGVATAKFASKELAQHAANTLNGREHMGMMLHVRMDSDTTVVGRAEPMVVNGSYRVSSMKSIWQISFWHGTALMIGYTMGYELILPLVISLGHGSTSEGTSRGSEKWRGVMMICRGYTTVAREGVVVVEHLSHCLVLLYVISNRSDTTSATEH
jgi:hypothetical protein